MGNLMKMSLRMLKILLLTAVFSAGMMFSISLIPNNLVLLRIIVSICFIAFEYLLIWDNFTIFGTKDSSHTAILDRRLKAEPEKVSDDDKKIRYIDYKGYLAGLIGSIPWFVLYIASCVCRLISLDPYSTPNTWFKFAHTLLNMPYCTLILEVDHDFGVPFALIISTVMAPIVAGAAYQMGHIRREYYLEAGKSKKYKKNPFT